MLIDPKTLTVGERLELSRRRSGLSQREAAALVGWPFKRYLKAEHGLDDGAPAPPILTLTVGEECRLMRKRKGFTLKEIEGLSGFKSRWIHRTELGQTRSARSLELFWRRHLEEKAK